ncbi:methyltransferase family protein [Microvirga mediterraneensis]|uniref:Isoprenylcysteine carboxylmethyltransferase family protein n=1 Tax=Microvirga mediterraneensis TaxID=2754695 RepID=A0A838BJV4_9HYPH|nr:isoprenylcysteine carboxylmethyltransferase family protein [Microvirga mediterraneensis]MBA1155894.1 isoprenylcysteine carboxylmethyltransferase family protein [Microvirga mediterraneensis]
MKSAIFQLRKVKLPFALDMLERATAATFLSFFAMRFLDDYMETGKVILLLQVVAECLIIGFLLVRRISNQVSLSPTDWCVAVAGTILPLFAIPGGEPLVPVSLSGAFMLTGIIINIWAKLSLRRSFGIVAANRGVKTNGPYNFVRHPMYFGYVVTQIGFLLANPTIHNIVCYLSASTFQVLRILAEERTLSQDQEYKIYTVKVRNRLIPGVF